MTATLSTPRAAPAPTRRMCCLSLLVAATGLPTLGGCSPEAVRFKSVDVTGASFAKDFRLKDHFGKVRTMGDFRGKVVVIFFGFTQCPDVCPTSMTTLGEVKRLLGERGALLQVLFITVDPERDTQQVLRSYMQNFDPTFLALRPEADELKSVANEFKIYYKKVDGRTPTSYTMDHSAGKYIFDTQGRVRLFSSYGAEAPVVAADIETLLKSAT